MSKPENRGRFYFFRCRWKRGRALKRCQVPFSRAVAHRSHVILWIILGMGLAARLVVAESLGVDLQKELRAARIVTRARIVAYDQDRLRFQPIPEPAAALSARYSSDPTWSPVRFIRDPWPGDDTGTLTAEWPPVGAEVLVVVDADGIVSLFARRIDEDYRFWSSIMTGSIAVFVCRPPARPLPGNEIPRKQGGADLAPASWDGCLMPVASVASRGVGKRRAP